MSTCAIWVIQLLDNSKMSYNNTQRYSPYSNSARESNQSIRRDLNRLFDLGWLRQEAFDAIREKVVKVGDASYEPFCEQLYADLFCRFAWDYLSSYRKSLPKIRRIVESNFPGDNPLKQLQQQRETCLRRFSALDFTGNFFRVEDLETLRLFIRAIPYDEDRAQSEIDEFFYLLDMISIITDVLNQHNREYDLNIKYSSFAEVETKAKFDERTIKITEPCVKATILKMVPELISYKYDWAVVYSVFRDRYCQMSIRDFVNEVSSWELPPGTKRCGENDISQGIKKHWLENQFTDWEDDDLRKRAVKLRKAIADAYREAHDE